MVPLNGTEKFFACVSFSFKLFAKHKKSRNLFDFDKHSLEPRVVDELPVGVPGLADLEGVGLGQRGDVDDPVAAARREEEARVGAVGAAAARRRGRPPLRHELAVRGNWNG